MIELKAHPNTRAIIEAWKRLSWGDSQLVDGPMAQDYPDVVSRLFIVQRTDVEDYSLRMVGAGIQELFGRELVEHNFLSLWTTSDRLIIKTAMETALSCGSPSLIQATAQTLDGRNIDIEVSFSPLDSGNKQRPRLLCLYQTLSDESALKGRPICRHFITGMFPPKPKSTAPILRVVS
ncbi:PAS domain-containing protein [Hirschia litorea]|uniref:PAS domain-containing protein n=1 Tax=Hirschia litorea TaxID=1199156 RepID=A0ABW2IL26_9PROT